MVYWVLKGQYDNCEHKILVGKFIVKWPYMKQSKWFIRSTLWMYQIFIQSLTPSQHPNKRKCLKTDIWRLSWHIQFVQAKKCFNTFIELIRLIQNEACFKKYMLQRIQQMWKINPSPVLFLSTHISEIKETPHVHYIIILKNE